MSEILSSTVMGLQENIKALQQDLHICSYNCPVISHSCGTLYLSLREEQWLRVFKIGR